MSSPYRVIAVVGCLLGSLCAGAQAGENMRKIVLPNPQLIHCRSAECSQLWKQDSGDGGVVYPAQVMTDFVNGEVVGLTAVYDKSVSKKELQAAINALYEKSAAHGDNGTVLEGLWRVESERIAISLFEYSDGTKRVIYLKFARGMADLVPSAHIDGDDHYTEPGKNTPPDFTGFWKARCSDAFGVQIKKQQGNLFSVSFCGPGGCFDPGTWMPNTPIVGDPQYLIYNPTTIAIGDPWRIYAKCTTDTNPKLDYSTMPVEQDTPAPKNP